MLSAKIATYEGKAERNMRRHRTWWQGLGVCLVTCGWLLACGGEPASEPEQAEAEEEFEEAFSLAQIPDDLPRYPGAEIAAFDNDSYEEGLTASFQSTDPAEKVHEFFTRQLPAHGWTIEIAKQLQDAYIIFANKGDIEVNIDVVKQDAGTTIELSMYLYEED